MLLCFYVMFFMYGHVSGCVSSDTDCNPLCPPPGYFCNNHKYELNTPFEPLEPNFPAIAAWLRRVEAFPGYERTYPPHWRA